MIASMRFLGTCLFVLLLAAPAMAVEPFRYRGSAPDGGTLEYIFESDEQNTPETVTEERIASLRISLQSFTAFRSVHWKRRNFGRSPFRIG